MNITHIYHSSFLVELEKSVLLFDWYRGDLPDIPSDKRLYVFCSHAHEDHYSPIIWDLCKDHPDTFYILDEGISDGKNHPEAKILFVKPHSIYEMSSDPSSAGDNDCIISMKEVPSGDISPDSAALPFMRIRTLTSTDMGVAFFVETEGYRIYHAGDLNVWFWYDEPMADNIASEEKCRGEMQYLADQLCDGAEKESGEKCLTDIAFVPLDPRLEEEAPRCIAAFMEILGTKYLFPMHFWRKEEKVRQYLSDPRISQYADRIFFDREMTVF